MPKSAQEETEKLTRSIATKDSENPWERKEWKCAELLPDTRSLCKKQQCFYVPAKTNWENVAKNILAFITAVTNRKHLGISLAETAQDLCGKIFNLVKSPKNRWEIRKLCPNYVSHSFASPRSTLKLIWKLTDNPIRKVLGPLTGRPENSYEK